MSNLTSPALSDGVIRLREWQVDDADAQVDAFADSLFIQFSDWAPITLDEVMERLAVQARERDAGTAIYLAIADADHPGTVLGEVSLFAVDLDQQRASVGYWLTPAARGRGAATRAVKLIADWAFADLGLSRLELTCGPDNIGSQRVAARCGFRHEGVLRSHISFKDGRRDSLVFGLLPSDLAPETLRAPQGTRGGGWGTSAATCGGSAMTADGR